jgi:hypothetical protein
MNGKEDRISSPCHFLEQPQDLFGRKGVQTARGFIQKSIGLRRDRE